MLSIDYEAALPHLRVKFAEMGLSFTDGTLAHAAAMGITQLVWRNGPIENAHAGERGMRNGLHDGVMFARNTWVFHQALEAVRSTDQYALLSFEDRILDRSLVWPGTRSTLSRFGYGALGDIRKHAKGRVNYLLELEDVYGQGSEDFLLLAGTGALFQQDRFGMPGWEPVVERIMVHLEPRTDPQGYVVEVRGRSCHRQAVWKHSLIQQRLQAAWPRSSSQQPDRMQDSTALVGADEPETQPRAAGRG
ncbi:hypothetical protein ACIREO_39410 [Streptomyces sp. NPDC102441]|uniref:hypothetical protein n=1 Tax=Streptomyces sp. NPDC102441 TaxID=3366176 RepID=UPI003804C48E